MPQLFSDIRTRQEPIDMPSGLAALPPATLARRRRLLRWAGVFTFLVAAGLSAIPGPKGASDTITFRNENGAKTQVHQFFFSRHYGLPFSPARADYNDDGSIRRVSIKPEAFLGNLGVALVIVIGASIFLGRRRREDSAL
jgi:hypothetical protein